jgi:peptidoglycan hydrolase CwlO-like protein
MENKVKPVKGGPKTPKIKKTISDVKQVTVDENVIDNYISKIVALENIEKANNKIIDQLNVKISDLKYSNVSLTNGNMQLKHTINELSDKLSLIPNWIKRLFGVK